MKIVLIGYMASGKSTIGRFLAEKKEYSFIDLDEYIEKKEHKTIAEIFSDKGEIYFRKQEHLYLKEILATSNNIIVSLGGGTPCYAGNMDIVLAAENTTSIYLSATIKTIVSRLSEEKNKRPLVANISDNELPEFIAKHLFERSYFYLQANFKISVDDTSIATITEKVIAVLP